MKTFYKPSDKLLDHLNTELADYVKNNDIKSVKKALAAGASVETWRDKETVLYRAVANRNLEIAELLLLQGANPNSNIEGKVLSYPLHKATTDKNCEMMSLLLDFGANIEVEDKYKYTPMMCARSLHFLAGRAVFLDYLEKDPAQCYFNRGKKVVLAAIDQELNRWCVFYETKKEQVRTRCASEISLQGLIKVLTHETLLYFDPIRYPGKNKHHREIVKELQLQESLAYLEQLLKLESKALVLDKKPDSQPLSIAKPTVISSTSDVNKILSLVSVKPSAPAASSVESEELAKALKESKAGQPESSSIYPKFFEVSASSVAVKTKTPSANLQKSASCNF